MRTGHTELAAEFRQCDAGGGGGGDRCDVDRYIYLGGGGEAEDDEGDYEEDDAGEEGENALMYVRKSVLEKLKEKLSKSEEVTDEDVDGLTGDLPQLPAEEVMAPVDMNAFGDDFALDPDDIQQKLGAKKVAELFVEAHKLCQDLPAEEKPEELTAAQLREVLFRCFAWRTPFAAVGEEEVVELGPG